MDKKPGSKFSLDSLMSRVLPSLDANPAAAATEGSKKFKRVRPVEGAITTATPSSSYVNVNPVVTSASTSSLTTPTTPAAKPTTAASKTPIRSNTTQGAPSILSDIAAAAASIFAEPQQQGSIQNTGSANNEIPTSGPGSSTKRKRNKKRKGGGQGNEASTNTLSTDSKERGTAHNLTEDSGTRNNQQKNNPNAKKKKKNENSGRRDDNQHGGGGRSGSNQMNESRQKKFRRIFDPQTKVRNLDATPELVGMSADDDFSTLLVQHVEHTNKMLQRDLEKQSKLMLEEQKKQAELLASQAAQLSDPTASLPTPQQQQQKKQKPKAPFVPRRDCNYFLKGFCKSDTECTFRHDIEARNAYQAGTLTITEGKVNSDLSQAAMYAM
ncbi:hypothetical protein BGZ76_002297 [Entomortierella beljakovae]|nr:hypothetical protein BGZ76_002297 [Entomortierella beljakovae]